MESEGGPARAKGCQQPPEAGKGKGSPRSLREQFVPAPASRSDFRCRKPELLWNFVVAALGGQGTLQWLSISERNQTAMTTGSGHPLSSPSLLPSLLCLPAGTARQRAHRPPCDSTKPTAQGLGRSRPLHLPFTEPLCWEGSSLLLPPSPSGLLLQVTSRVMCPPNCRHFPPSPHDPHPPCPRSTSSHTEMSTPIFLSP